MIKTYKQSNKINGSHALASVVNLEEKYRLILIVQIYIVALMIYEMYRKKILKNLLIMKHINHDKLICL